MGACSQIGINCEQTIARQRDIEYPQDTKCTARQQNRDGIAALLKYLKKFVQEVNFYPLQGAYGEGNNNFLIFILFKHIEDGGESIDSVNSDYSAS